MLASQWHRVVLAVLVTLCCGFEQSSEASPPRRSSRGHYPRVYSPTGSLYGPTQARYQWNKQYGRPWHGYRGISYPSYRGFASHGHHHRHHSHHHHHYSPYYYSAPYFGLTFSSLGYGSSFYVGPTFPVYYPSYPAYGFYSVPPVGLAPQTSPPAYQVLSEHRRQRELKELEEAKAIRQAQPIRTARQPAVVEFHKPEETKRIFKSSTDAEKLESFRLETQGNVAFKRGQFVNAYLLYKQAAAAADDRAEPHLRMALSFAALSQFSRASDELKQAIARAPQVSLPEKTLSDVFGASNEIAKTQMIQKTTDWVDADVSSADRLFLLGALLHFDGREKQAAALFEQAQELAPQDELIAQFLKPDSELTAQSPNSEGSNTPETFPIPPLPQPPAPSAPATSKRQDGPRFPTVPPTTQD